MKTILIWMLPLMMGNVCQAEDITISYDGATAKVEQTKKDSVKVTVNGAQVNVESTYTSHHLSLRLKGKSNDGQLVLKTAGKAKVTLDNLSLTSQEGAPLTLKNKKKVEIVAAKGTVNTLSITACNDDIGLVTLFQEIEVLEDRVSRASVPEIVICCNSRGKYIQSALFTTEIPPF